MNPLIKLIQRHFSDEPANLAMTSLKLLIPNLALKIFGVVKEKKNNGNVSCDP